MQCAYFDAGECRSCTLMGVPYPEQLRGKEEALRGLLAAHEGIHWLPTVASRESGYRNKAKMVIGGTIEAPTIGLLGPGARGVDIRECGICEPGLVDVFPALARFIGLARLEPYDVPARRGELKAVLVTESAVGELMLRFVLRSEEALARIRKHLPALLAEVPRLAVVTVNLQPKPAAILEGEREIVLTESSLLRMPVGGLDLALRPQGFFQTNTAIAEALYGQAAEWAGELDPASVWDLYSGVGGFALATADGRREVLGIEVSADAVEAARAAAREAGLERVRFEAGDATEFAEQAASAPELVIVNPPRRGIGPRLAAWLEASTARYVVYSSCNAETLASDLAAMPSLVPTRVRMLDMFPQTAHFEAIALLERA
ncbi:23S rRNA (uracil(747)-C(5))-methyltransferase RlmC [Agromyces archimandritae]|uniref:23S rRNA (Uracil(747)-C(5))-methyltransferase RlmC n=1 Tax=Agromyces archimandritae TaxID=2781962 RepID=A0A975FKT1_9MICO|nr:23S rRNA (uracil(747)-C(5))-methyltransferase RlmC [Agromyces archimandritae]QTX03747.1 23S rRNA (uracil(747)-C(5))-methyltransferase RlmC [Agromyces archimandritae]